MQRPRYALLGLAVSALDYTLGRVGGWSDSTKLKTATLCSACGTAVYPSRVRQRQACADRPCGTAGKCVVDAWMSAGNTYAPSAPSAPVPVVAMGYVSCAAAEEEYWTDCSAAAACVGSERLIASTCDGCALPPRRRPSRRAFALGACQPPSLPLWSYFTVASLCAGRPCRAFATGCVQCVPTLEHPDRPLCAGARVFSALDRSARSAVGNGYYRFRKR
jgi:hypothetical protein